MEKMISNQPYYLLLDEIQEVTQWEKAINSLMVDAVVDIYLTGSNSHLLSSELATYLTGRFVEIPIYTLSFNEFLVFKETHANPSQNENNAFIEYLRKGGFPVVHAHHYDEETMQKVVKDICISLVARYDYEI